MNLIETVYSKCSQLTHKELEGRKTFKPLDRDFPGLDPNTTLHPLSDRILAIQTARLDRGKSSPQKIHFLDLANPEQQTSPWENRSHCSYLNHRENRAYFGASGSLHYVDPHNVDKVERHECTSATIRNCCDLRDGRSVTISEANIRFWQVNGQQLEVIGCPRGMTVRGGGQTGNGMIYVWTTEGGKEHLRVCSSRPQRNELLDKKYHTAPLHSSYVFTDSAILSLSKTDDHKLVCQAWKGMEKGGLEPLWREPSVLGEESSVPLSASMGSMQLPTRSAEWAGENEDSFAVRIEEGKLGRFLTLRKTDGELSEIPYNTEEVRQPTLIGDRVVGIVETESADSPYRVGELTSPPPTPSRFFTSRRIAATIALLILAFTVIRRLKRRSIGMLPPSPAVPKPDLSAPPSQWYVFPSKRPDPGLPWTHPLNRVWY